MLHARLHPDGHLSDCWERPVTFPDDVPVPRVAPLPGEIVTIVDGKIVPHAALMAARDLERRQRAAEDAELRALARERLKARGLWPT